MHAAPEDRKIELPADPGGEAGGDGVEGRGPDADAYEIGADSPNFLEEEFCLLFAGRFDAVVYPVLEEDLVNLEAFLSEDRCQQADAAVFYDIEGDEDDGESSLPHEALPVSPGRRVDGIVIAR